jgi:acetolactate synthase-1/2/3 large subunit
MDWVQIGQGFGVKSARAETMEELNALMADSFTHKGPFLIEAVIP